MEHGLGGGGTFYVDFFFFKGESCYKPSVGKDAICSNMDGCRDYVDLSEVSQEAKDISYDITYIDSKIGHT